MSEDLGAVLLADGRCRFRVWAPLSERVYLHIIAPNESVVCMEPKQFGYHTVSIENIRRGARYRYRLSNGGEFADPASRHQPEGVHGPSEVVETYFAWHDQQWFGVPI